MRSVAREVLSALGLTPGKNPRNVKFDYGVTPSVAGQNTVINFTTPFSQLPTVTFGNNVAWNADSALRIVGLTNAAVTVVVATSGNVHWMAVGP